MKTILVTGGAGYIGSHAVRSLIDSGYSVVAVDNLSKGHKSAVDKRAFFVKLDLEDRDALQKVFEDYDFSAVMHFAGSIEVGLSMKNPALFFKNNVLNGVNLLEAMRKAGVKKIIFSSTAAVYGEPEKIPIRENAPLNPTNFYGVSKLMFEDLLKKYDQLYGFRYVSLRYFNASGADESGKIGQDYLPDTHLIPIVLKTVMKKYDTVKIYGDDYPTRDGTCIRDYIHVSDLVDAHILALKYLFEGKESNVFNLGNGEGFSVKEVIKEAENVVSHKIPCEISGRREGDPAVLVADSEKARKILRWNPRRSSLGNILSTAWKWHSGNPDGYRD
jgi:UDP-glucose 4-epimerase